MRINLYPYLKNLSRRIITAIIITITAGTTLWALAAFTEPSAGPADSDQDFTQNILGANNANNDFDSSLVSANSDGSIVERLEYIIDSLGG